MIVTEIIAYLVLLNNIGKLVFVTIIPICFQILPQSLTAFCTPKFKLQKGMENKTHHEWPEQDECLAKEPISILEIKIYAYGIISFTIIIFGILGNVLSLATFQRSRTKTSSVIYIIGKTIVDLLTLIFTTPWATKYWAQQQRWKSQWWSYFQCHLQIAFGNAFVGAGVLHMMVITTDMFLSMRYPLKFRVQKAPVSNGKSYIISGAISIFSLVCFIPQTFEKEIRQISDENEGKMFVCCDNKNVTESRWFSTYIWSQQAVFRFFPVFLILILNFVTAVTYKKIIAKREMMKTRGEIKREESSLTSMLLIFSIMFLVCMIPSSLNMIFAGDDKRLDVQYQLYRAAANILEVIGYSSPFYVYYMTSKEFRRKFMQACKKKNQRVEPAIAFIDTKSAPMQ